MRSNPEMDAKPWRWIESDHWELQFEALPRRVPWFEGDQMPPLKSYDNPISNNFPIERLYHAVHAMVASEPNPPPDPRFRDFVARIELGNDLVHAFEDGDFIAAAGILREMERVSAPCGSLLFNQAFLHRQNGDPEAARESYRQATELCPDVEMLWVHYARESETAGDRAEAIRGFHEARRILPNHEQATLALERLGELFRVAKPESPDSVRFINKAELEQLSTANVNDAWQNAGALRSLGVSILQGQQLPALALRAIQRAAELDPGDNAGSCLLATALRVNGQFDEAIALLEGLFDPEHPDVWILFHLAECCVAQGEVPRAWEELQHALRLDPNHQPSLQLFFLARTDQTDLQKEAALVAFAAPDPASDRPASFRALLLAANSAWKRNAREVAVRHAAVAYERAPDDQEAFFTYTGMLGAIGEHEWVAALTKPRLLVGEKTPTAFMNFARALRALGLHEEAVAQLHRALAELPLDREVRAGFIELLDEWTSRFAHSEVPAETQPGGDALKRSIFQIAEGQNAFLIFEGGMGFPQRRALPVGFKKPRVSFDFTLEQRNHQADDPQHFALGTFTVSEIDPDALEKTPVQLEILLDEQACVCLGARQGERKLAVVWSLYPPPRHEPSDA